MIRFFVPGHPAPKGSRTGHGGVRDANPRTKQWVEDVATIAMQARNRAPDMPYRIDREYVMPRPNKPTHGWPSTLDIDKLDRALFDGLTKGGVIADDRHIITGTHWKRYAEPGEETGVHVRIQTARVL